MSESKPETSSPTPNALPDLPAPKEIAGVPLDTFVKGGTTSDAWDREKQFFHAQSDHLRAHQDLQRQAVEDAHEHGGVMAGIHSLQLTHGGHPKVAILYKRRDSALNIEAVAELTVAPNPTDLAGDPIIQFQLVCPKCMERVGRMDDAQVNLRSDQKPFWIRYASEPDFPAHKRVYVSPTTGEVFKIAGLITTRDICRCPALGCNWAFRIDESVLTEI